MISHLVTSLCRLWLKAPARAAAQPCAGDIDSNWHSSSFELARGLEVIEHRGLPPAVFADTLPAYQPPKA